MRQEYRADILAKKLHSNIVKPNGTYEVEIMYADGRYDHTVTYEVSELEESDDDSAELLSTDFNLRDAIYNCLRGLVLSDEYVIRSIGGYTRLHLADLNVVTGKLKFYNPETDRKKLSENKAVMEYAGNRYLKPFIRSYGSRRLFMDSLGFLFIKVHNSEHHVSTYVIV